MIHGQLVFTLYYTLCILGPLELAKAELLRKNLKIGGYLLCLMTDSSASRNLCSLTTWYLFWYRNLEWIQSNNLSCTFWTLVLPFLPYVLCIADFQMKLRNLRWLTGIKTYWITINPRSAVRTSKVPLTCSRIWVKLTICCRKITLRVLCKGNLTWILRIAITNY